MFEKCSRAFNKRKLGGGSKKKVVVESLPKRRRLKTFQLSVQLSNMIRLRTGKHLIDFVYKPDDAGNWLADPYNWLSFSMSPDKGVECVAVSTFLPYEKFVNCTTDFDLALDVKCATRCALKTAKLWNHCVTATSAHNVTYGSTLSPPRLQAIKECFTEFVDEGGIQSEYFQFVLPLICMALKCGTLPTDPGAEQAENQSWVVHGLGICSVHSAMFRAFHQFGMF